VISACTPGSTFGEIRAWPAGYSHSTSALPSAGAGLGLSGGSRVVHPRILFAASHVESVPHREAPAPLPGPRCDDTQPLGEHPFYPGLSVSALYDKVFRPAAEIPYLDSHVPQTVKVWENWDGAGHDLLLLGMYQDYHDSYLVGLDPVSGQEVGTLAVAPSHLGGMGFLGDWLFTQDDSPPRGGPYHPAVRRYRIADLRAAMRAAAETGQLVRLDADGPADPIDAIDFFVVDGDSVYAGNPGNPIPGRMYRYQLSPTGHLRSVEGPWSIPPRAQGLVVTPDDFIFAGDEGHDRGKLTVLRRAAPDRMRAAVGCLWMPAMPEDLTVYHGNLITEFESGASKYAPDHPRNVITHLHASPLTALLELTDPVVLPAGVQFEPVPDPAAPPGDATATT
jgi:hypothetical protein